MVNFAWVLFRAADIGAAGRYLLAMFGANWRVASRKDMKST